MKWSGLVLFEKGPWDGERRRFTKAPAMIELTMGVYRLIAGTFGPTYVWTPKNAR
jgi:hypothetical protein